MNWFVYIRNTSNNTIQDTNCRSYLFEVKRHEACIIFILLAVSRFIIINIISLVFVAVLKWVVLILAVCYFCSKQVVQWVYYGTPTSHNNVCLDQHIIHW